MTKNVAATLRQCHKIVWEARKQLEQYWPTPTTEDALLFAFTELGESIDAHLRTRSEYARNRDKDLDVLSELADTALMALTALGPQIDYVDTLEWDTPVDSEGWVTLLSKLNIAYAFYLEANKYYAVGPQRDDVLRASRFHLWRLVICIATHPGMDLPQRLTQRLERIAWRRKPLGPDATTEDRERWFYGNYKYTHGGELSWEEWKVWSKSPLADGEYTIRPRPTPEQLDKIVEIVREANIPSSDATG